MEKSTKLDQVTGNYSFEGANLESEGEAEGESAAGGAAEEPDVATSQTEAAESQLDVTTWQSSDQPDVTTSETASPDRVTTRADSPGRDQVYSPRRLTDYLLSRDRPRRTIRPPPCFAHADIIAYALNVGDSIELEEPGSFTEAWKSSDKEDWLKAMEEEMHSLMKNKTWKLVDRPLHKKVIGCRWIFKRKHGIPGVEPARFKARVVAKGFSQVEGIDYHEVFSPVVKHSSIRLILAMVAMNDLELEQLDVKTAFPHVNLDEEIFMEQPKGFIKKEAENKVCLLQKSLYGLKQSPRQWYRRFDEFILSKDFKRSDFDHCVYYKTIKNETFIYLLLYVQLSKKCHQV